MNYLNKFINLFTGDFHHFSMEHRLFNLLTLLNGILNFGVIFSLDLYTYWDIILLHILTGLVFIILFLISRIKAIYRPLFWPFMLLLFSFLTYNIILNAGSMGGAQYYLIPALVIGAVLAHNKFEVLGCILLSALAVAALFIIETFFPAMIQDYENPGDRVQDVFGNFFFVQLLTAVIVLAMSRTLNQERVRSDRLLLNILPESIASELKSNDRVEPLHYDSASVLFTDFVGFTTIAETMQPAELIAELDDCFRVFDAIIEKHNMEKIKTIGDAYMAVGGVPTANRTHAVDTVLAGLEIQAAMQKLAEEKTSQGKPYWEIRLGIHSGPLVAGVIGRRKFAYDVWGDTVNLASRMESSGSAGRLNISADTYGLVENFFECEHRGKIQAKHKGEVDMYFVNGIRPELYAQDQALEPNILFKERYLQLKAAIDA